MIGRTGRQPFTSLGTFQTLGATKHAVETRMRWLSDKEVRWALFGGPKRRLRLSRFTALTIVWRCKTAAVDSGLCQKAGADRFAEIRTGPAMREG
jgi:hypothetical protein